MMTSEVGTVQAQVHHRQVKKLWIDCIFFLWSKNWFSKDWHFTIFSYWYWKNFKFLCFCFGILLIDLADQNCYFSRDRIKYSYYRGIIILLPYCLKILESMVERTLRKIVEKIRDRAIMASEATALSLSECKMS